jgi:hypothetical protein
MAITQLQPHKAKNHLVSDTGAVGPRIDVVIRIFQRIEDYEEEVRMGRQIPNSKKLDVKIGKRKNAITEK